MRCTFRIKLPRLIANSKLLNRHLNFSTTTAKGFQIYNSLTEEHSLYNSLLNMCLQQCQIVQSRQVFEEMPKRLGLSLKTGKIVHALSLKLGISSKGNLGNAILDLYSKCGHIDYAERVFLRLEERDKMAWNSIMFIYSRNGFLESVVEAFGSMWNRGVLGNQFSCAIVLSACAKLMDLKSGKQVHCGVVKMGFEVDAFCEGSLIDMYSKCGYIEDARKIFDGATDHDTVSCTAMISGYVQVGLLEQAMEMFEEMRTGSHMPDQVAFVTTINACVKLGCLDDACHLFSQMPNPNIVAWNVLISGHAKGGHEGEAIGLLRNMIKADFKPTRSTLGSVLSAIAYLVNYEYGLQVHGLAMKLGLDSNVYVGSSLISMYAKCQKMEAAKEVFNGLGEKNDVLWNALLGGYAQNGYACEVLELFLNMRICGFHPDEYTYTSALSACACLGNIETGSQLHSVIIKNKFEQNLFVGNALVDMYAKCGALANSRKQFELIKSRDHVSWNAIIVGYVQEEEEEGAFSLFRRMMSEGIAPDEVSLASILSATANLQDLYKGTQVHCFLVKYGLERALYACGSLIDFYCKCGIIGSAIKVFSCMTERSVACTNALIAGYAQVNLVEAVNIFQNMLAGGLRPSEVTFATLLESCTGDTNLHFGKQIHCSILKLGLAHHDEFIAVSVLGMYMNAQKMTDANIFFCELPYPKSTIIWTAMISGSIQNDCCENALFWYSEMCHHNAKPDQATFASVLRACSMLASLEDGRKMHSLIFRTAYNEDELIGSALVDMYAKCGDMRSSAHVFGEMVSKKDVISWNSIIVGYAKNGYAENALKIFEEMNQAHVKPDEVTFLGVLTACNHAGMVFEGQKIFNNMIHCYGVRPRIDHCACMIDLFGRWGFLKEAEEFIVNLDFEPDAMLWSTYLGACRLHGDDVRGQYAAEKLIQLQPQNSSPYVLLSNIYAESGNWEGVNSVRTKMQERGVKKFPGYSWRS